MRKKSQIKFGETFGVIIIVYVIILVGLIWYNSINNTQIKRIYEKNLENEAFEKYQYIINFNLIHRSERGDVDELFDYASLKTMANFSRTKIGKEYLSRRLSLATIKLDIYNRSAFNGINQTNMEEEIILYNNTPKKNQDILETPIYKTLIPIHDDLTGKNKIGALYIKSYILNR